MDSQIQCPVCTLYLLVGMNLQDHLDTHPKEKVISALVNLTLLQQKANDEVSDKFQCSRYEPLAEDLQVATPIPATSQNSFQNQQSIAYYPSVEQPTSRQVMIVNQTRVFHERSGVVSKDTSRRQILGKAVPPLSIPTRTFRIISTKGVNTTNTSQHIPPPPPYYASVQEKLARRSSMQRTETNLFQHTSTGKQISESIELPQNIGNSVEMNPNSDAFNLDDEQCTTQPQNNLDVNNSTEENHLSEENIVSEANDIGKTTPKQISTISKEYERTTDQEEQHQHQDVTINNDGQLVSITEPVEQDQVQDMDIDESCSVIHINNCQVKKESNECIGIEVEKAPEKRTPGLKVLSNVKVSPNTVLNVSSLNSQMNESISMNNMIIIGSSSSSSSTSLPPSPPTPSSTIASSQQPASAKLALKVDFTKTANITDGKHTVSQNIFIVFFSVYIII